MDSLHGVKISMAQRNKASGYMKRGRRRKRGGRQASSKIAMSPYGIINPNRVGGRAVVVSFVWRFRT